MSLREKNLVEKTKFFHLISVCFGNSGTSRLSALSSSVFIVCVLCYCLAVIIGTDSSPGERKRHKPKQNNHHQQIIPTQLQWLGKAELCLCVCYVRIAPPRSRKRKLSEVKRQKRPSFPTVLWSKCPIKCPSKLKKKKKRFTARKHEYCTKRKTKATDLIPGTCIHYIMSWKRV